MFTSEENAQILGRGAYAILPGSSLEKKFLNQQGNACTDLTRLYFASEGACAAAITFIKDCTFIPDSTDGSGIFIGNFSKTDRVNVSVSGRGRGLICEDGEDEGVLYIPSGLYRTTFTGKCYLSTACRVSDTMLLRNVFVGSHAAVVGCGTLACTRRISGGSSGKDALGTSADADADADSDSGFGYGSKLHVGAENGGRDLSLRPRWGYVEYCREALRIGSPFPATAPSTAPGTTPATAAADAASTSVSIIGSYALMHSCSAVEDVFVARRSTVHNSQLHNCTVLCAAAEGGSEAGGASVIANAIICNSVISENVHVEGPCKVTNCYISEHVHIGTGALVECSVIGPDSGISRGECLHSLVGPFTGFHHSSLLIAALWPLGRGNLGYGSMLGSNHTGKVNDQECWPGEGCFFGLGAMVKYPCNLIGSQYSLIASNTLLGPLRVALPFSLFAPFKESIANFSNISKGHTSHTAVVLPGWVLYGNPYLLERAASKFKARRQAVHTTTDFGLYRPTILDTVRSSLADLRAYVAAAGSSSGAACGKGQEDIAGQSLHRLGEVYLSAEAAQKGVHAYHSLLKRYALHGLLVLAPLTRAQVENLTPQVQTQVEDLTDVLPSIDSVRNGGLSLETSGGGGMASDLNLMQHGRATAKDSNNAASSEGCISACTSGMWNMPAYSLASQECLVHQWCVLQELYAAVPPGNGVTSTARLTYDHVQYYIHLLSELPGLESAHAHAVQACKARDDIKGVSTVPHYSMTNKSMKAALAHESAGGIRGDELVVAAWQRAQQVEAAVQSLILCKTAP